MLDLIRREDIPPRCPHCDTDLSALLYQALSGMLGKRYVYFCSNCRAVLGVSHRKGFWMG